jgi:predicted nucleic acid-binding protein
MATLLDTSALVVLLRRRPPEGKEVVAATARARLGEGSAIVSSLTVAELLVGARDRSAEGKVMELLGRLPVVALDREVGELAGRMGRAARAAGATLPLPDLAIAATASWLGVPLLTADRDFARGEELARKARARDPWHGFELDPGSVVS